MNESYMKLIQSDRISDRTRDVLLNRAAQPSHNRKPQAVSPTQFATLAAMVSLLIPQQGGEHCIEIAALLDAQCASGNGDGWRYAALPEDRIALPQGLDLLEVSARDRHGHSFASLAYGDQVELLKDMQAGKPASTSFDSKLWFEDMLAQTIEIYVSNPATMAAMGFTGIAFLPGWPQIGLNTTQSWEPVEDQKAEG